MTLALQGSGVMAVQSGAWTLQLEAVLLPAVSKHQSGGGALRIHPVSRVGLSCLSGTLEGSGFRPAFPS